MADYISTSTLQLGSWAGQTSGAESRAYLERLLARVDQLVPLQFGALHERLAALGAHVHTWTVRVQVLPHGRVVAEHLGAALSTVWAELSYWCSLVTSSVATKFCLGGQIHGHPSPPTPKI